MGDFTNPEFLNTLSFSDKLTNSLMVTVLGMAITFFILILLMFSIKLLSKVAGKTKNVEIVEEDDLELVAVLTAAISEYNRSDSKVVVHSYKEIKPGV